MPLVWAVILLFYLVIDHGLFSINNRLPLQLFLWSLGFIGSSFIIEKITPDSVWKTTNQKPQPNENLLKAYIILFIIAVVVIGFNTLNKALQYGKLFFYLRAINVGYDDMAIDFGIFNNLAILGIIVYLIELERFSSKNKWKVIFLLLLNVFFYGLTMSKTNFLALTVSSLYILYLKGHINVKKIAIAVLIFGVFSVILQYFRSLEKDNLDLVNFFSVYLVSSSVAFDQIAFPPTENFGENTFRLFYAITHAFGGSTPPIDTKLDFVYIGSVTNTYTTLYPFYVDFRTVGVLIFSILSGMIYGYISKKAITGSTVQQIQYAYFSCYIVMQFIGDFFFTNLSFTLQLILFAFLPYILSVDETKYATS